MRSWLHLLWQSPKRRPLLPGLDHADARLIAVCNDGSAPTYGKVRVVSIMVDWRPPGNPWPSVTLGHVVGRDGTGCSPARRKAGGLHSLPRPEARPACDSKLVLCLKFFGWLFEAGSGAIGVPGGTTVIVRGALLALLEAGGGALSPFQQGR